jgi:hypothetical protein
VVASACKTPGLGLGITGSTNVDMVMNATKSASLEMGGGVRNVEVVATQGKLGPQR